MEDEWHYNYAGALEESIIQNKEIPTVEQWETYINAIPTGNTPGNLFDKTMVLHGIRLHFTNFSSVKAL
jgi:hypothetical protein